MFFDDSTFMVFRFIYFCFVLVGDLISIIKEETKKEKKKIQTWNRIFFKIDKKLSSLNHSCSGKNFHVLRQNEGVFKLVDWD